MKNYRKTLVACYLGFVTQAIAANFAPLLFLKFHYDYSIPLGMIALIPAVFYVTQLIVDVLCAKFVDMVGYRSCVVASEVTSALGLVGLVVLPDLFQDPFTGIIISVVVYSVGSGLIEVLVSPIVEACPFDNKDTVMSTLHSFYCWGFVVVVLLSTGFFALFGIANWKWLACFWALVPLYNIYNFLTCPIEHPVPDGQGLTMRQLFRVPTYWIVLVVMICTGICECTMGQWASAFAENALRLSKTSGDLLGPCLFAASMGICRTFYGKYGDRIDLSRYMIGSAVLCLCCYLLASFLADTVFGLIGCIVCGFSVGIMWPGTISLCSQKIPRGGTAMFALLAMAGDLGGSAGPAIAGKVAQEAGDQLQAGMQVGCIFPIIMIIMLVLLSRNNKRKTSA